MGRRYDTVSLLTDYGTADEFAGVLRCVVRDLAPHAAVVDISHEVPPFDVRAGSLMLARAISYVPAGVVVAVVDPGVGTDRRAIAVEVAGGDGVLIGPDNGLLVPAAAMAGGAERAVVLDRPQFHLEAPGATFAGRDVFVAVAAHLCNGVPLDEVGTPIEPDALLPGVVPLARQEGGEWLTEVLWVDRFGNCQLNVGPDDVADLGSAVRVMIGAGTADPVVRSATRTDAFFGLGPGALGLLTDSYGMLALVLDRRSAAAELGLGPGDQVVLGAADAEPSGVAAPVQLRTGR
jgi:S-adenosylmethionine hydrolase